MADRGSGCMGQARPNLSNQAYRPDAEPPAAGPGQTGGTPLPGGPTARLCYFLPPTARPFGGTSFRESPTPAAATNDADPDDADRARWPPFGRRLTGLMAPADIRIWYIACFSLRLCLGETLANFKILPVFPWTAAEAPPREPWQEKWALTYLSKNFRQGPGFCLRFP